MRNLAKKQPTNDSTKQKKKERKDSPYYEIGGIFNSAVLVVMGLPEAERNLLMVFRLFKQGK